MNIEDLTNYVSANPTLTAGLGVLAAAIWPVLRAWLKALERKANQAWLDHGDDDDEEIKVRRVTDLMQAESTLMSMLPRAIVEKQVRKMKGSIPPLPETETNGKTKR